MEIAKLKGSVDSSGIAEVLKDILIPVQRRQEGVSLQATPVVLVDPGSKIKLMSAYPWGRGAPSWAKDETANNSSKTVLTVPLGHIYDLRSLYVSFASTGTAGNRTVIVEIIDSAAAVIATFDIGVTQAASLTYRYLYGPNVPLDTTAPALSMGIPPMLLLEGYSVKVRDSTAVDAAADDMSTYVQYLDYEE